MAKKQTDNEIIDEIIAASSVEETPVITEVVAEEPTAVVEELEVAPHVIEDTVEVVEVTEEVVEEKAPAAKKDKKKAPGMYYNGELIEKITAKLGKKWTAIIGGQRAKVLKSDIEIVE